MDRHGRSSAGKATKRTGFMPKPRCIEGNYGLPGLLHGEGGVEEGRFLPKAEGSRFLPPLDNTNDALLTLTEGPLPGTHCNNRVLRKDP